MVSIKDQMEEKLLQYVKIMDRVELPVLKVGRKVLIKTDILEMFMEANEGRDLRDRGNVKAVTRTVAN